MGGSVIVGTPEERVAMRQQQIAQTNYRAPNQYMYGNYVGQVPTGDQVWGGMWGPNGPATSNQNPGLQTTLYQGSAQTAGQHALGSIANLIGQMSIPGQSPYTQDPYRRLYGQVYQGAYQTDPRVQQQLTNALMSSNPSGPSDPQRYLLKQASDLEQMASQKYDFSPVQAQAQQSLANAISQQRAAASSARGIPPAMAARMAQAGGDAARAQTQAAMPLLKAQGEQAWQQRQMQARQAASDAYAQAANLGIQDQSQRDQLAQAVLGQMSEQNRNRMFGSMAGEQAAQNYYGQMAGLNQSLIDTTQGIRQAELGIMPNPPTWPTIVGAGLQGAGTFGSMYMMRGGQKTP